MSYFLGMHVSVVNGMRGIILTHKAPNSDLILPAALTVLAMGLCGHIDCEHGHHQVVSRWK
jgi:hypothetical protein